MNKSRIPNQEPLTGWVPVFGNPPKTATTPTSNPIAPLVAMGSLFVVLTMVIAWSLGLLVSPDEQLTRQSADLEQQLTQTQNELATLKQCLGGGN